MVGVTAAIEFIDKDGDLVRFEHTSEGKIQYFMKGELRLLDVTVSPLSDGCLEIRSRAAHESKPRRVRPHPEQCSMDAAAISAALNCRGSARAGTPEPPSRLSCLADLTLNVLRIPNPQRLEDGRPGEARLQQFVCEWLQARSIDFESDPAWGVHAFIDTSAGHVGRPGVLLAAHMDSDVLDEEALASLALDPGVGAIRHRGDVGLDCKTGVALALFALERLRAAQPPVGAVHVLFTVGEESGQKGALRVPLAERFAGRVRHAIVIDRMTCGANAPRGHDRKPVRHVVTKYKGVPLLDPGSGPEMLALLRDSAARLPGAEGGLPAIESPNCSDALELRGRWDAEVVAREYLREHPQDQKLAKAVQDYDAVTRFIREAIAVLPADERVSSMNRPPRSTRYEAMLRVHQLLNDGRRSDRRLGFSCVNLSYDYDESRGSLSLKELGDTASILMTFVELYAASFPVRSDLVARSA